VRLVGGSTVVVRGDDFRAAVMRAFGARSLQSAMFSVRRSGDSLTFQGRGAGHGVGLCQAGAVRLAEQGQSPEAILRHYFPGTALTRLPKN
jgi:stage II sporulation protein D